MNLYFLNWRLMTIPSNLRGMLLMVFAMGAFIASDSCTKFAMADLPIFQLVVMRGYAGITLCLILVVTLGQAHYLQQMFNPWLLARGICELGANFGFTFAILHMPISDVTAIAQTCPLLVLVGAKLIWGEHLGLPRLMLIIMGITGAMMVAQPGATAASPYALLGFLVAASAATRDLITRNVPTGIPAAVVALAVLVVLTIVGAICLPIFETPVFPSMRNMGLMILSGALMVGGHMGVFLAFKIGPVRSVAPFMYSLILWAVLSSVVLFGDIPNALAVAGMALIIAAGLLVFYFDSRQKLATVI